jgi:Profilin
VSRRDPGGPERSQRGETRTSAGCLSGSLLTPTLHGPWQLSTQEQKAIVDGFADPDKIRGAGVHLAGVKYMTLQADEGRIIGKKGVRDTP